MDLVLKFSIGIAALVLVCLCVRAVILFLESKRRERYRDEYTGIVRREQSESRDRHWRGGRK